jgi:hypothetical protein
MLVPLHTFASWYVTHVFYETMLTVLPKVYYSLCSDASWNDRTTAGFDLQAFYYGILHYLNDPEMKKWTDPVFRYWNK